MMVDMVLRMAANMVAQHGGERRGGEHGAGLSEALRSRRHACHPSPHLRRQQAAQLPVHPPSSGVVALCAVAGRRWPEHAGLEGQPVVHQAVALLLHLQQAQAQGTMVVVLQD